MATVLYRNLAGLATLHATRLPVVYCAPVKGKRGQGSERRPGRDRGRGATSVSKSSERRLRTFERLQRCLAVYAVVAARIQRMTFLARQQPDASCLLVLSTEEWQARNL